MNVGSLFSGVGGLDLAVEQHFGADSEGRARAGTPRRRPHRPARDRNVTSVYAACMTLIIAAHLPYGIPVWAAVWCVVLYRATSKPRNSGVPLTNGERS